MKFQIVLSKDVQGFTLRRHGTDGKVEVHRGSSHTLDIMWC